MSAKKSLGQNFLTSKKIVEDIISSSNLSDESIVLEVGPGKGILTEALLKNSMKVIAVEKDSDLIGLLNEKFESEINEGRFILINDDILTLDLKNIVPEKYTLVANIPYYITGALFKKFLSSDNQPERIVVMVQKEVAKRIVSRDGKESILSISVKSYGLPKYVQKVPARFFSPKPKVDSAILLIEGISKNFFSDIPEEKFFEIVKAGFAHKRKILIRNLEILYSSDFLHDSFSSCHVSLKARSENLSPADWKCLTKNLVD